MTTLYSRAAACGLVRYADEWGSRDGTRTYAWRGRSDSWHVEEPARDELYPTEDAALAVVVEFLEAEASEAGHPYCVPFSDEQKKSMARCPTCRELYVFDTIIETTSGDPLPHPMDMGPMVKDHDLMVHHTPAAVERWEAAVVQVSLGHEPHVVAFGPFAEGWEPLNLASVDRHGVQTWGARRLPAGVAR